jgi:hypothetical protein
MKHNKLLIRIGRIGFFAAGCVYNSSRGNETQNASVKGYGPVISAPGNENQMYRWKNTLLDPSNKVLPNENYKYIRHPDYT